MFTNFRQQQPFFNPKDRPTMSSSKRLLIGLTIAALLVSACQSSEDSLNANETQPEDAQSETTATEPLVQEETVPEASSTEPDGPRPDAPSYALRGPHGVGYQSLVTGEATAQPLEISAWYPALNTAGATEEIVYDIAIKDATWSSDTPLVAYGQALQNADLDDLNGPYPLVVLSHGFSFSATWYGNLAEHYASHGFVVLGPDHTEQYDPEFSDVWKSVIDRPEDVKQTLDYAEALNAPGGDMAGLIDMEHVALVGHSSGGYTVLAAAGAQLDMTGLQARCATVPADDVAAFLFCGPLVPRTQDMADRAGLDSVPNGLWPSVGDPRVTSVISMAGESFQFDQTGLSSITVPVMAITGSADTASPPAWGATPTYELVSSKDKALVSLSGAEHMVFTTPCANLPWIEDHPAYGLFCFDPVWDEHRSLDLINHLSTAFLLDTLNSEPAAHDALLPDAVQFPGIEYTTTID